MIVVPENKRATYQFEREASYKIGAVTYQVTAHYDEQGEALQDKMKRLLLDRIEKSTFGAGRAM